MTPPDLRALALQAAVDWAGDRAQVAEHPGTTEVLAAAQQFAHYLDTGQIQITSREKWSA